MKKYDRSAYLAVHLALNAKVKGNPRFYTTYLDESLNQVFIRIAASCHRMTFERRVFAKYKAWVLRQGGVDVVSFW